MTAPHLALLKAGQTGVASPVNCVVTAGPTIEPLDQVRRLTNFSTGRLGGELAARLAAAGHHVTLLLAEQALWTGPAPGVAVERFTTTQSLRERLQAASALPVDALFHAAAVSDFAFGKIWFRAPDGALHEVRSGKISTRQGALLAELVPTPKLIAEMRGWFPTARIAGWKYEVDGPRDAVLRAAREQIRLNRTDVCVANGPAYGPGFGLVTGAEHLPVADAAGLYEVLERWAGMAPGAP